MGEKERERQKGLCAGKRGGSKELRAERNRLTWVAYLPPRATVMSRPGLMPRAMSGSVALMQPW